MSDVLIRDERIVYFDDATGDIFTFDGDKWNLDGDRFGEGVVPSKSAVVGTAVVGKDIVG